MIFRGVPEMRNSLGLSYSKAIPVSRLARLGIPAVFAVCLLLFSSAPRLHAQALSGIQGTVTDESGAVVPGATVTITNNGTGVVSHAVTGSVGTYTVTDLIPGTYTVKIEKSGFRAWVSNNVNVEVGRNASVDALLKPGVATESVVVEASPISLETSEPELGTLLERKAFEELPVPLGSDIGARGRQIDDFLFLAPGVTGGGFSHRINGGLDFQNEVVFNGVVANQSETQGLQTNINPPYEMVGEFRVETSVFSAQYGLAQGVAAYQFASGTNTLHGDAFEVMRNSYFDARDAVTAAAGGPTPVDHENNYGFTFGGPVYLPKIYNRRDKTFFHVSLEWYRLNQGITGTMTVPTAAMKQGDFSAFPQPIYIPADFVAPSGCTPGAPNGSPWPNSKIPTSCFSPTSQSLLVAIPAPDVPGATFNGNKLADLKSLPTRNTLGGFSIDHNLTENQKLHGSYWRSAYNTPAEDNGAPFSNILSDLKNEPRVGTGLFLTYSNAISSTLVTTAGFGWMGEINNEFNAHVGNPFSPVAQSTILPTISFSGDPFVPTSWGVNSNGETFSINRKLGVSFDNNWLWTHGRHTLNTGFEVRRSYQDDHECQDCGGNFSFSSLTTSSGLTSGALNENNTGSSFASFLLGTPDSAFRHFALETKLRNFYVAPYVQDNIKITSRLTVDVGLRWDIMRPFTAEAVNGQPANQIVFFDAKAPNPGAIRTGTGQPQLGAANVLGNCSGCAGYSRADTHWHNFSPRLGSAYKLNSKTVLLSGYALNYLDTGGYEYGVNKVAVNYGNILASDFTAASNGTNTPGYCNINGVPNPGCTWDTFQMPLPAPSAFSATIANGTGNLHQFSRDRGAASYVQAWNVAIQRELPRNMFLSVGYIGNRGTHLVSRLDTPNQVDPSFLNLGCVLLERWTATTNSGSCVSSVTPQQALQNLGFGQDANGFFSPYANFFNDFGGGQTLNQAIRPYPQYFGMVDNFDLSGVDHYNALQTQIQKRFSGGVSFLVAYTLSKTMSNADSGFSTFDENPVNKFNKKQLWSIAGDDRTHVLNISGIYELPIGPGKQLLGHSSGPLAKNLLSGWQFSGVFQYASNTPMRIGANGSPLRTGNIANVVSGQPLSVDYNNYYKGLPVFNIGAFSSPGRFAVGDAPRRIDGFRGAFTGNENLALAKHFYFSERVSAELRMEFYNVLNRMRVCGPETNVDSSNFGIVNGGSVCQDNSPRRGQAFFKVSF